MRQAEVDQQDLHQQWRAAKDRHVAEGEHPQQPHPGITQQRDAHAHGTAKDERGQAQTERDLNRLLQQRQGPDE
ncbi:hypothetical protein D3C73_1329620 [compost metagenome]